MLKISDYFAVVNFRITEGSEYTWQCYGSSAYTISAWNGEHEQGGWSASCTFDTVSQTVYEVDVCDYERGRAYRLINPDYRRAYDSEAGDQGDWANQAWDSVDFVDLEVEEDWLTKARAIVSGQAYDTRISVPLELEDQALFALMRQAHEEDCTLNQLVERVLTEAVKRARAAQQTG